MAEAGSENDEVEREKRNKGQDKGENGIQSGRRRRKEEDGDVKDEREREKSLSLTHTRCSLHHEKEKSNLMKAGNQRCSPPTRGNG